MSEKPYLTPNEAAAMLMIAPATLRVWADKGLIKARVTAGGHRRFQRSELERFLRDQSYAQRILIVDDDPALTRYLVLLLSGYDAVTTAVAHDGFDAGLLVQTFRPHVILLDLMMPGLDGFQVCEKIKAEPHSRNTRIIAMTGYCSPENQERILAAGAETCLPKPLDEADLLTRLGLDARKER
ncbi:MAG: response regulator [Betaproteobacteria bacterium]|nr:response regulator [Betaproteobacteria bacterium]